MKQEPNLSESIGKNEIERGNKRANDGPDRKREKIEKARGNLTATNASGGTSAATTALALLDVPRLTTAATADSVGLVVATTKALGTLGL